MLSFPVGQLLFSRWEQFSKNYRSNQASENFDEIIQVDDKLSPEDVINEIATNGFLKVQEYLNKPSPEQLGLCLAALQKLQEITLKNLPLESIRRENDNPFIAGFELLQVTQTMLSLMQPDEELLPTIPGIDVLVVRLKETLQDAYTYSEKASAAIEHIERAITLLLFIDDITLNASNNPHLPPSKETSSLIKKNYIFLIEEYLDLYKAVKEKGQSRDFFIAGHMEKNSPGESSFSCRHWYIKDWAVQNGHLSSTIEIVSNWESQLIDFANTTNNSNIAQFPEQLKTILFEIFPARFGALLDDLNNNLINYDTFVNAIHISIPDKISGEMRNAIVICINNLLESLKLNPAQEKNVVTASAISKTAVQEFSLSQTLKRSKKASELSSENHNSILQNLSSKPEYLKEDISAAIDFLNSTMDQHNFQFPSLHGWIPAAHGSIPLLHYALKTQDANFIRHILDNCPHVILNCVAENDGNNTTLHLLVNLNYSMADIFAIYHYDNDAQKALLSQNVTGHTFMHSLVENSFYSDDEVLEILQQIFNDNSSKPFLKDWLFLTLANKSNIFSLAAKRNLPQVMRFLLNYFSQVIDESKPDQRADLFVRAFQTEDPALSPSHLALSENNLAVLSPLIHAGAMQFDLKSNARAHLPNVSGILYKKMPLGWNITETKDLILVSHFSQYYWAALYRSWYGHTKASLPLVEKDTLLRLISLLEENVSLPKGNKQLESWIAKLIIWQWYILHPESSKTFVMPPLPAIRLRDMHKEAFIACVMFLLSLMVTIVCATLLGYYVHNDNSNLQSSTILCEEIAQVCAMYGGAVPKEVGRTFPCYPTITADPRYSERWESQCCDLDPYCIDGINEPSMQIDQYKKLSSAHILVRVFSGTFMGATIVSSLVMSCLGCNEFEKLDRKRREDYRKLENDHPPLPADYNSLKEGLIALFKQLAEQHTVVSISNNARNATNSDQVWDLNLCKALLSEALEILMRCQLNTLPVKLPNKILSEPNIPVSTSKPFLPIMKAKGKGKAKVEPAFEEEKPLLEGSNRKNVYGGV